MSLYGDGPELEFQRFRKQKTTNERGFLGHFKVTESFSYTARTPECEKKPRPSWGTPIGKPFRAKAEWSFYDYVVAQGGLVSFVGRLPDPPDTS